jgi:uncharacterized membrane protein
MLRTLVLIVIAGGVAGSAIGQDIPIGFYRFGVPEGYRESRPGAISGDGSRIIGTSQAIGVGAPKWSFEWTHSGGLVLTAAQPAADMTAWTGLSADGVVAAGWGPEPATGGYSARSWSPGGLPTILGRYSGYQDTITHDVSGDGRVIVGRSETVIGLSSIGVPVRWTAETGFVSMGPVPGGATRGRAIATNFDGSVAVGYASDVSVGAQVAFRWSETDGYTVYPSLVRFDSISADGQWMGGTEPGGYPVRVAADGRIEQLDPGRSTFGVPRAMNSDGSIIVGDGFLWEASTGMHRLDTYFASIGVTVPADLSVIGFRNEVVRMSDDGTRILGWSVNSSNQLEGWLAVIPSPGGLAVLLCASALGVSRRR